MKTMNATIPAILWLALGCASSPPPVQQMADAQSATRSADELGARSNPQAQLHLRLAEDQVSQARAAMKDDDNQRAEKLLARAKADAELAIALTRAATAEHKADDARNQLTAQRGTTAGQGE
jgi:hypothetical protein